MTNKEIKAMDTEDLLETLKDTQNSLKRSRFAHSIASLENPITLKKMRRDVARLKTELHSRTLSQIRIAIENGTCNLNNIDNFLKDNTFATTAKRSKVKALVKNLAT